MNKLILMMVLSTLSLMTHAAIRLPKALDSHMVLQQKSTTKLWGWANPSEKIKIVTSWNKKEYEIVADGNANWKVDIQTPAAGGPYTITLNGENSIVLNDILIGEVWVCSGQSNMEWSYNLGIKSIKADFEQLRKLNIRLFNTTKRTSSSPQDDTEGMWTICDSNTIKAFSAVGYYFGKQLSQELNVPIGLISSNWGGTPAETWTPTALVEHDTTLKNATLKNAETPWWPVTPGYAYNAMIAPFSNFTIAGTIWYQGESNRESPSTYTQLIHTMVDAWRRAWHNDFPFYYVQIAPYRYERHHIGALVREAQAKNLSGKKMGMVVISDLVSDTLNIHPTNKKDVGLRLANMALGDTYGKEVGIYKSPMMHSYSVQGNKMTIVLENAGKGLKIKGKEVKELFVAGADQVFYPAQAKLDQDRIVVSSNMVNKPVAVRYQFSNAGIGNIYSKDGLPVAPFRTDQWQVNTSPLKP